PPRADYRDTSQHRSAGQSKTATNIGGFSGVTSVKGSSGIDTLVGPDAASMWNITGADSGNVGAVTIARNARRGVQVWLLRTHTQDLYVFRVHVAARALRRQRVRVLRGSSAGEWYRALARLLTHGSFFVLPKLPSLELTACATFA